MKKIIYIFSLILLFYFSYHFKNFPLFMLSISFFVLLGFFFKKINKNFLLILFSISMTITLIESTLFYLKTGKFVQNNSGKKTSSDIKYQKTFLGYQPKPGVYKYSIKKYTIGNNKFRVTPEINDLKKNKTISFFGGSFTFGYGLNDDETMPYLLQNYFKEWKINNYGINGYGVHQMLAHIQKDPKIIQDVNILVTDDGHIPRSSCQKHFSFGTPKFIFNDQKKLIRFGYCHFGVMDKIPLPKIIGSIINRSEIKNHIHQIFKVKDYYSNENVELYLAIIKKINETITKKEKKFFVGYMNNSNKLNKDIIKELIENNINVIDLSLEQNKKEYWLPDRHTTKEGNGKRAAIIFKYLNKNFIN